MNRKRTGIHMEQDNKNMKGDIINEYFYRQTK